MIRPVLTLFLIFCLGACSAQSAGENVITAAQAREMMTKDNVVFLDVRTPAEVKRGKIENAQTINYYDADFNEKIQNLPKNVTYVVYCARGSRSAKVMRLMKQLGYENLYDLGGGYLQWQQTENPE